MAHQQTHPLRWLNPLHAIKAAKRMAERHLYGDTFWSHYRHLDLFVPLGRGQQPDIIRLAFQAVSASFPLLEQIVDETGANRAREVTAEAFCETDAERDASLRLKALFDRYGSDKGAADHEYHLVYGAILTRINPIKALLEVGLGSNHENIVSNMGSSGKPGASLRAFRDFLPEAEIFGADVDRLILFEEERIRTFFIDQADPDSFREVEALGSFDLVIDDGLHSPSANLAILLLGLRRIPVGGWVLIEDIPTRALPVWKVVGALLPPRYRTTIIRTRHDMLLFAVERIG